MQTVSPLFRFETVKTARLAPFRVLFIHGQNPTGLMMTRLPLSFSIAANVRASRRVSFR